MKSPIPAIRRTLKELATEETRTVTRRFFKEPIKLHGVKAPVVKKVAAEHFASLKGTPKAEVFALCDTLWASGMLEEIGVACEWIHRFRKEFTPDDFSRFEAWIDTYVTNWATCDSFCTRTMGTFVTMYPRYVADLKRWTKSENLWTRRASAVSLIDPAKKGLFHDEIFQIATTLLHDPEDLIQKAYGWLLKSAADADCDTVFRFVMAHKATMPRTALRYAIEKMPKELKVKAMEK